MNVDSIDNNRIQLSNSLFESKGNEETATEGKIRGTEAEEEEEEDDDEGEDSESAHNLSLELGQN